MKKINLKWASIFLVIIAFLLNIFDILSIPRILQLPEVARMPQPFLIIAIFMQLIFFVAYLISLIFIIKNKRVGYLIASIISVFEFVISLEDPVVFIFTLILCVVSFYSYLNLKNESIFTTSDDKPLIDKLKESFTKEKNLKRVIIFLIVLGILFKILSAFSLSSKLGVNPLLFLIAGSIFIIPFLISLILIIKDKKIGYGISGWTTVAFFFQAFDSILGGTTVSTSDIVVNFVFLIVLGSASFFIYYKLPQKSVLTSVWAYSKFPKEQLSDTDIKKKKMFSSFFVVILIIFFAVLLTFQNKGNTETVNIKPSIKIISPQDGLTFNGGNKTTLQWQSGNLSSSSDHPLILNVLLTSENSEKIGCGIGEYSFNPVPSNYLLASIDIYLPLKVCVGKYSDGVNSELGNPYTVTVEIEDFSTKEIIIKDSISLNIKN